MNEKKSHRTMKPSSHEGADALSPLRVRLVAYLVMILVAVASIWLIDQRAMQRQGEIQTSHAEAD